MRQSLRHEIRALQRRLGVTTIMVTHDQEEALAMADRIVVMNHGVVEQVGTPVEVYTRPRSPFVARFVGQMNFLSAVAALSAAGFAFFPITSSQNLSIALVSLSCSIPFSFTIAAAPLPFRNISVKPSLPCLPLIFPLSTKLTSSSSASGGIGQSLMVLPAVLSAFCKSLRIQFATFFGFFASLTAASKYRARSRSFASTLAS